MYKIGEFSKLSKATIKTLRYYEKEGLLIPKYIDANNGYRYYESNQLIEISKIISLRQIGFSIEEIKKLISNKISFDELLNNKKNEIEENIKQYNYQLLKINYLLEESNIENEIFEKVIPSYYVYYKEGILKDYSEMSEFIIGSANECLELNPDIKCITPDYCYVNYLDEEHKEQNIKIRYAQAVINDDKPFVENDSIKFMNIPEEKCICIYHKGSYEDLGRSYSKILNFIENNNYEIKDYPRECYIDGIWNKDDVADWLTEIQIPIASK